MTRTKDLLYLDLPEDGDQTYPRHHQDFWHLPQTAIDCDWQEFAELVDDPERPEIYMEYSQLLQQLRLNLSLEVARGRKETVQRGETDRTT